MKVLLAALVVVSGSAMVAAAPPVAAAPMGTSTTYVTTVSTPQGITSGPDGNLWFTNGLGGYSSNRGNTIGRITPTGTITAFTDPSVVDPNGIVSGPDGNLWFVNVGRPPVGTPGGPGWDMSIGRITPDGAITHFNGSNMTSLGGITVGSDGNLWFTNNSVPSYFGAVGTTALERITPDGTITVFADPKLTSLRAITTGPDGNLWFTNGSTIGTMTTAGVVTTYGDASIAGPSAITAGPDGNLWFTNATNNSIGSITPTGTISNHTGTGIAAPSGITAAADGNLWFTNQANDSIGRITTGGTVSNFTGTGIDGALGITAGPDGNLWFANFANSTIGRSGIDGVNTSFAGNGISEPNGTIVGPDGNIWFTNAGNYTIGRVTPAGVISNFDTPGLHASSLLSGPDGNIWFTLGDSDVGRITPSGVISIFTAPASALSISELTIGPDGNLWFTSHLSNHIGRITMAGAFTFFSGGLTKPDGLIAGPDGNLWFTNGLSGAYLPTGLGRITPTGIITLFGGIRGPRGLVAGADGNVWFKEMDGRAIGRITPTGTVESFPASYLGRSTQLIATPDGNLWFTDGFNYLYRITLGGAITAFPIPAGIDNLDLVLGPDGNLWFPHTGSIGQIANDGTFRSFAAPAIPGVVGLAFGPDGNVWFGNGVNAVTSVGVELLGAPTGVTAAPGDESAAVSWTAPLADGGSPINGYVVTATPGGATCVTTGATTCTVGGLTNGVEYRFTVTASNIYATGPPSTASNAIVPRGRAFHPVTPFRLLDSRTSTGGWGTPLPSGTTRELAVTGGDVPAWATAIVMNVTVTNPTEGSYLTVWPAGDPQPGTSNLNFGPGETIPNLVMVKVGPSGLVDFANAGGTTDVVVDVAGYFDDSRGDGDLFNPMASGPYRLADTRDAACLCGGPLVAGDAARDFPIRPTPLPPTATAAVLNVTVTASDADSFVSVWPSGLPQPSSSNLNFGAGETIANLVVTPIGTDGAISVATAQGNTDVVIDVVGYFDPTSGSRFHPLAPKRLLDDRYDIGLSGPWTPGATRGLVVTGSLGIPVGATAIVGNLTATQGTEGSFVTVFPHGRTVPTTSNLNFGPGQTIPNLVVAAPDAGGSIDLFNQAGNVDLVLDAAGYFATF